MSKFWKAALVKYPFSILTTALFFFLILRWTDSRYITSSIFQEVGARRLTVHLFRHVFPENWGYKSAGYSEWVTKIWAIYNPLFELMICISLQFTRSRNIRKISPFCLCTDHSFVLLYRTITSLQEITWIAGAETSGATDVMLLFYEPAEYHKFSINSPFKCRCACVSVHIYIYIYIFNRPCVE